MSSSARTARKPISKTQLGASEGLPDIVEAEAVLLDLARVFADSGTAPGHVIDHPAQKNAKPADGPAPNLEAKYRALLEQIPAVVFMAYLDRGISEAYVSPQIEAAAHSPRR
jgi:hypothetical protein